MSTKYCEITQEERDCILVALRVYRTTHNELSDEEYKFLTHLTIKLKSHFSDARSLP